jgi:hypothetical protein
VLARPYFLTPKDIENAVVLAGGVPVHFATYSSVRAVRIVQCNIAGFYGIYWNGFSSDTFSDRRDRMVTTATFRAVP